MSTENKPWIRRYLALPTLAGLGVLAFIMFCGDNSLIHKVEYQRQIDSLQAEVDRTRDSVDYYHELNERLASDPEAMERVVREQYRMKRDHEEVFVYD